MTCVRNEPSKKWGVDVCVAYSHDRRSFKNSNKNYLF